MQDTRMMMLRGFAISVLAVLMACGARANGDLSAEDQDRVWMAESLAVRHSLYADARELAEKITDVNTRQVTIAKVLMAEASNSAPDARLHLQSEALKLVGELKSDGGRLAYVEMLLDVAEGNGPQSGDRERMLRAIDRARDLRKEMDGKRSATFNYFDQVVPNVNYINFIGTYYQEARAHFLIAKIEPANSEVRSKRIEQVANTIMDLQFEQLHWIKAEFDAYILNGDARLLDGDPSGAVANYLLLPSALSNFDSGITLVRDQSLRGYLKAVETLATHLASDPTTPKRIQTEVDKALAAYPGAGRTVQGKELSIFKVAAETRMGGDPAAALSALFALVSDDEPTVRRKAARQLAELAAGNRLNNAQRIEAAKRVASVREYEVMLLAVHALQAMLANLKGAQEFESFGPYAYALIAGVYEQMGRFLDAITVYREGASRFRYFRDANPQWDSSSEKLPPHFFDAGGNPYCVTTLGTQELKLATQGDAFEYPRLMAARALDAARWLNSREIGDQNNPVFSALLREIDDWYVPFAGEEQKFKVIKQRGYDEYRRGQSAPRARLDSAVYLLSVPAADRGSVNASFFAGTALVLAYTATQPPPATGDLTQGVSRDAFFRSGYRLLDIDFPGHGAQIDTDFAKLPASLRAELKALADQLSGPQAVRDSAQYWWLMSQYALKRALLLNFSYDPSKLEALGANGRKVTIAEAFDAWCEASNAQFLARPVEERSPSPAMIQAGKVILQLVYSLGNPRLSDITDPAQRTARQRELSDANKGQMSELLLTAWKNIGPHFDAALRSSSDPKETADLNVLLRTMLTGLFREMVDSANIAEAEAAFDAFRTRFANDDAGKTVQNMAGELFNLLLRVERPRADVLRFAADGLDAIGVVIGKTEFLNHFASLDYFNRTGGPAKAEGWEAMGDAAKRELIQKAWDALTMPQRRQAVADYVHGRIESGFLGANATTKPRGASEEVKLAERLPRGEAERWAEFWSKLVADFSALHKSASRAALVDTINHTANEEGKKILNQALAKLDAEGPDAAIAELEAASTKINTTDLALSGAVVGARIRVSDVASDLEVGSGPAFRAAVRAYIEARAQAFRDLAKRPLERFLGADRRLREIRNEPLVSQDRASAMGELFSAVGDWTAAYEAWKMVFKAREAVYGDISFIPVNAERFVLTFDEERAEEIRVRLELARAGVELAKDQSLAKPRRHELLNEAIHHARRVYAIMQWRDGADTFDREPRWRQNLAASATGRQIEKSYIPALILYSEILERFVAEGLRPKWEAKFYAQHFRWLSKEEVEKQKADQQFYKLPAEPAEMLLEASNCQWSLRTFGDLPGGFHSAYYRAALPKWAALKIEEAKVYRQLGQTDKANDAAGAAVRLVWSEWNRRKGQAYDDASVTFVANLRTIYEQARAMVSPEWMLANAKQVKDAEDAEAKAKSGG